MSAAATPGAVAGTKSAPSPVHCMDTVKVPSPRSSTDPRTVLRLDTDSEGHGSTAGDPLPQRVSLLVRAREPRPRGATLAAGRVPAHPNLLQVDGCFHQTAYAGYNVFSRAVKA